MHHSSNNDNPPTKTQHPRSESQQHSGHTSGAAAYPIRALQSPIQYLPSQHDQIGGITRNANALLESAGAIPSSGSTSNMQHSKEWREGLLAMFSQHNRHGGHTNSNSHAQQSFAAASVPSSDREILYQQQLLLSQNSNINVFQSGLNPATMDHFFREDDLRQAIPRHLRMLAHNATTVDHPRQEDSTHTTESIRLHYPQHWQTQPSALQLESGESGSNLESFSVLSASAAEHRGGIKPSHTILFADSNHAPNSDIFRNDESLNRGLFMGERVPLQPQNETVQSQLSQEHLHYQTARNPSISHRENHTDPNKKNQQPDVTGNVMEKAMSINANMQQIYPGNIKSATPNKSVPILPSSGPTAGINVNLPPSIPAAQHHHAFESGSSASINVKRAKKLPTKRNQTDRKNTRKMNSTRNMPVRYYQPPEKFTASKHPSAPKVIIEIIDDDDDDDDKQPPNSSDLNGDIFADGLSDDEHNLMFSKDDNMLVNEDIFLDDGLFNVESSLLRPRLQTSPGGEVTHSVDNIAAKNQLSAGIALSAQFSQFAPGHARDNNPNKNVNRKIGSSPSGKSMEAPVLSTSNVTSPENMAWKRVAQNVSLSNKIELNNTPSKESPHLTKALPETRIEPSIHQNRSVGVAQSKILCEKKKPLVSNCISGIDGSMAVGPAQKISGQPESGVDGCPPIMKRKKKKEKMSRVGANGKDIAAVSTPPDIVSPTQKELHGCPPITNKKESLNLQSIEGHGNVGISSTTNNHGGFLNSQSKTSHNQISSTVTNRKEKPDDCFPELKPTQINNATELGSKPTSSAVSPSMPKRYHLPSRKDKMKGREEKIIMKDSLPKHKSTPINHATGLGNKPTSSTVSRSIPKRYHLPLRKDRMKGKGEKISAKGNDIGSSRVEMCVNDSAIDFRKPQKLSQPQALTNASEKTNLHAVMKGDQSGKLQGEKNGVILDPLTKNMRQKFLEENVVEVDSSAAPHHCSPSNDQSNMKTEHMPARNKNDYENNFAQMEQISCVRVNENKPKTKSSPSLPMGPNQSENKTFGPQTVLNKKDVVTKSNSAEESTQCVMEERKVMPPKLQLENRIEGINTRAEKLGSPANQIGSTKDIETKKLVEATTPSPQGPEKLGKVAAASGKSPKNQSVPIRKSSRKSKPTERLGLGELYIDQLRRAIRQSYDEAKEQHELGKIPENDVGHIEKDASDGEKPDKVELIHGSDSTQVEDKALSFPGKDTECTSVCNENLRKITGHEKASAVINSSGVKTIVGLGGNESSKGERINDVSTALTTIQTDQKWSSENDEGEDSCAPSYSNIANGQKCQTKVPDCIRRDNLPIGSQTQKADSVGLTCNVGTSIETTSKKDAGFRCDGISCGMSIMDSPTIPMDDIDEEELAGKNSSPTSVNCNTAGASVQVLLCAGNKSQNVPSEGEYETTTNNAESKAILKTLPSAAAKVETDDYNRKEHRLQESLSEPTDTSQDGIFCKINSTSSPHNNGTNSISQESNCAATVSSVKERNPEHADTPLDNIMDGCSSTKTFSQDSIYHDDLCHGENEPENARVLCAIEDNESPKLYKRHDHPSLENSEDCSGILFEEQLEKSKIVSSNNEVLQPAEEELSGEIFADKLVLDESDVIQKSIESDDRTCETAATKHVDSATLAKRDEEVNASVHDQISSDFVIRRDHDVNEVLECCTSAEKGVEESNCPLRNGKSQETELIVEVCGTKSDQNLSGQFQNDHESNLIPSLPRKANGENDRITLSITEGNKSVADGTGAGNDASLISATPVQKSVQNESISPTVVTDAPKEQDDNAIQTPSSTKVDTSSTVEFTPSMLCREISESPIALRQKSYPFAPMGQLWHETSNKVKAGGTLMGRRWVWDEGYFVDKQLDHSLDGIRHMLGEERKNNVMARGLRPLKLGCNCGASHAALDSKSKINSTNEVVASGRTRRSERSSSSTRMSSVISELATGRLNPHTLITCEEYTWGPEFRFLKKHSVQPFSVRVSPDATFVADLHAHLCEAEIIGFLGGHYSAEEKCIYVQAAFPCKSTDRSDSGQTDVEMDPVSQIYAREAIANHGMSVVGWYHSHPTFQPDPSVTDIENQANYQQLFQADFSSQGSTNDGLYCMNNSNESVASNSSEESREESNAKNKFVSPFVGLIVGTYDIRNPTSHSIMRWFHVTPKKTDNYISVNFPMNLKTTHRQYREFDSKHATEEGKIRQAMTLRSADIRKALELRYLSCPITDYSQVGLSGLDLAKLVAHSSPGSNSNENDCSDNLHANNDSMKYEGYSEGNCHISEQICSDSDKGSNRLDMISGTKSIISKGTSHSKESQLMDGNRFFQLNGEDSNSILLTECLFGEVEKEKSKSISPLYFTAKEESLLNIACESAIYDVVAGVIWLAVEREQRISTEKTDEQKDLIPENMPASSSAILELLLQKSISGSNEIDNKLYQMIHSIGENESAILGECEIVDGNDAAMTHSVDVVLSHYAPKSKRINPFVTWSGAGDKGAIGKDSIQTPTSELDTSWRDYYMSEVLQMKPVDTKGGLVYQGGSRMKRGHKIASCLLRWTRCMQLNPHFALNSSDSFEFNHVSGGVCFDHEKEIRQSHEDSYDTSKDSPSDNGFIYFTAEVMRLLAARWREVRGMTQKKRSLPKGAQPALKKKRGRPKKSESDLSSDVVNPKKKQKTEN